ncbi:MAG: TolC family protein [Bacteroidales bacterium]
MYAKKLLTGLLISFSIHCFSQTSYNYILDQISSNNKGLQYMRQSAEAGKTSNKLVNNLKNPSLTYQHKHADDQLSVSQSFDFPTAYYYRSQVNKLKGKQLDALFENYRQDLLLTAKLTCLKIIFLNQQNEVLHTRLQNSLDLAALYQVRVNEGKSNPLDKNKIDLEQINTEANLKTNEAALFAARSELQALNGGIPLEFDFLAYPDTSIGIDTTHLKERYIQSDYEYIAQNIGNQIADKQITVARTNNLPGIELEYKQNIINDHKPGYNIGISVPVFANRNKLKLAKQNQIASELQQEALARNLDSEYDQLIAQYKGLCESLLQFRKLFKTQNNLDIINKYIHSENITMIDYFVELNSYYASLQTLLELENQYQIIISKLEKYKL